MNGGSCYCNKKSSTFYKRRARRDMEIKNKNYGNNIKKKENKKEKKHKINKNNKRIVE